MVFEVQLVVTEKGLVPPGKLDYPITFKIPVHNTMLQADEVLQVSNCSTGILDHDTALLYPKIFLITILGNIET
jgi:hypothetical protein